VLQVLSFKVTISRQIARLPLLQAYTHTKYNFFFFHFFTKLFNLLDQIENNTTYLHVVGLHAIKKTHNKIEGHQEITCEEIKINVKAHGFPVLGDRMSRM